VRYVISNTSIIISYYKIRSFLNSQAQGESVKSSTVASYLDALEKAYTVYRVNRFDIIGINNARAKSNIRPVRCSSGG